MTDTATEIKPTIPEVLPLVYAYRDLPGNGVGGNLHNVLDDRNVRNKDVLFCRDEAHAAGDVPGVALAELLLRMSKTQRLKICGLFYAKQAPAGALAR